MVTVTWEVIYVTQRKKRFGWKKINEWSESVEAVAAIAEYVHQAAFAGMQRALQQEWTFVQRVVPNIGPLYTKLENAIFEIFFSKLFGEKKIYRN